ncbi:DUF1540 domain-containing protein [Clostridium sp.]|uniref:DUF1540 domain-containing protein n=1 Tax=Clostridium sp. TaxID=1506 RepID=UPI002FCB08B0
MRRSDLLRSENVECKATRCIHNNKSECMAGVISVKGMTAMSTPETSCVTFVEEGGYGYDHLSNYYDNSVTKTRNIKCAAGNCKYNNNEECYAEVIQINAANASCDSFECN